MVDREVDWMKVLAVRLMFVGCGRVGREGREGRERREGVDGGRLR